MTTISNEIFFTIVLTTALILLACWYIIYTAVKAGTKKAIIDILHDKRFMDKLHNNK